MYKDFFLNHMIVHSFMNYNRKLELDLVVTSMTTQIIKGLKLQKITLDIYMIKTLIVDIILKDEIKITKHNVLNYILVSS